ncbi:MAG: LPS-assembly lipoprotein [Halieaceae bacterium]
MQTDIEQTKLIDWRQIRARRLIAPALSVALLLSGCGFHLRGSLELPPGWQQINISGDSPNGDLQRELTQGLQSSGIEVASGGITLQLGPERRNRRNIALDAGATASEFEVELSSTLGITDAQGTVILEPTPVAVQRLMNHDPNDVVGEAEEIRLLERELRSELVQQILRRLRFLANANARQV